MSAIEEVAFSSAVLCTKPSGKWMCQVLHGLFRLDSGRFRAEHVAMLDSDEEVAVFQRGQPVGNDEGSAAAHEPFHRLHNGSLGLRIDGARRTARVPGG